MIQAKFETTKTFMCTFSYEIQEEGPVQQISYVSDKERGYLRIVSAEDEADFLRFVVMERHGLPLNPGH